MGGRARVDRACRLMNKRLCTWSPEPGEKGMADPGGRPKEGQAAAPGPTHLQQLCGTGPGLRVLIQGRLQEVAELRGPGGTGGAVSAGRGETAPRDGSLSRESCASRTRLPQGALGS